MKIWIDISASCDIHPWKATSTFCCVARAPGCAGTTPRLKPSLMRIMSMTGGRQCSDGRDRIYGLLGLMPLAYAGKVIPDYSVSPSMPLKALFMDYLQQTFRLDIRGSNMGSRHIDWPTWIPALVYNSDLSGLIAYGFARRLSSYPEAKSPFSAHS